MNDGMLTTPNPRTVPSGGTSISPVGGTGCGPAGPAIRRLWLADTTIHARCNGSKRTGTGSPSVSGRVTAAIEAMSPGSMEATLAAAWSLTIKGWQPHTRVRSTSATFQPSAWYG